MAITLRKSGKEYKEILVWLKENNVEARVGNSDGFDFFVSTEKFEEHLNHTVDWNGRSTSYWEIPGEIYYRFKIDDLEKLIQFKLTWC